MLQLTLGAARRVAGFGRRAARSAFRRARAAARHGQFYAVRPHHPVRAENLLPGSRGWERRRGGGRNGDDRQLQIKGYCSLSSVAVTETIDFHVSVAPASDFTIAVYRIGYYGGTGGRCVAKSPKLRGVTQAPPKIDEMGTITCDWPAAWRLRIPSGWVSGMYLAVFTTASGWRNFAPFVVRDHRKADLCVLLPFSTYQAYNQWPFDGRRGKSLYYGFNVEQAANGASEPALATLAANAEPAQTLDGTQDHGLRARAVSFDRPYAHDGLPNRIDYDWNFIQWAEREGWRVTYADSMDLHTGKVDPTRYAGLVFCGHDEYWSGAMRQAAQRAVADGVSLAYLTANNVYWNVRIRPSADGRPNRTITCYKGDADPDPDEFGATGQWRDPSPRPNRPEQELLGVQYNGVVREAKPLIVTAADHWFWAGCDVADGDEIGLVVKGEADGFSPDLPRPNAIDHTLLSSSPFELKSTGETRIQNTSVYETPRGNIVFDAATLDWPAALGNPKLVDRRIQQATTNLFRRILRSR